MHFRVFFHGTWLEMRPRSWKGLEFYKKHMVKWKGTQEHHHITLGSAPLTRSVSCSVVCPYVWPAWSSDLGLGMPWSQSSCGVLTAWGCWESGGGQPALAWKKRAKKKKKKLHKLFWSVCVQEVNLWSHPVQHSATPICMFARRAGDYVCLCCFFCFLFQVKD